MEALRRAITELTMTVGRLAGGYEAMVSEFRGERESSAASRKSMYQALDEVRHEQQRVATEIRATAARVERLEPAVEDYNKRQVQLETGGKLAKAAWWLGGLVMLATVTIGSNWDRITGALRGWHGK
jgi:chromosome segregation ATPase